ncbi:MAG: hypothetical protein ACREVK_02255 [Gammaproteobacteria bacterium]
MFAEKRDPSSIQRREVLLVYQEVSLYAQGTAQESETPPVYTVSVDEKPGVQTPGRHYPSGTVIRVVLDNHSAHSSKETIVYLATRLGRFEYIHTPKHL